MTVLTIDSGDDRSATVVLEDAAGLPLNLANCEVVFTVRRRVGAPEVVMEKSIGAGVEVTSAAEGRCSILFDAADTEDLDSTPRYRWDIQVTDSEGLVRTPDGGRGRFVVIADISEAAGS